MNELPNVAELKSRLKSFLENPLKLRIGNPSITCVKNKLKKTPHAGLGLQQET
jgi:hypothetical protein